MFTYFVNLANLGSFFVACFCCSGPFFVGHETVYDLDDCTLIPVIFGVFGLGVEISKAR
ncbi:hypothetical protein CJ030_MR5G010481 [Morella rubra]|uniref:Uncharacterized protein n=1 Tax=Morella rubra TaxID=262757 RepID=A0A6A1VS87_9ROSI|nr:hypothetical protein CJ030_MR5G010481 [Morella rubra]